MINGFEFRAGCPQDAAKVDAFNRRLAAAGETYHRLSLQQPFRTMRHREHSPIKVEKLFCFNSDEIRGGVNVKQMIFWINGTPEPVAFSCYQLSEGIVNRSFNNVGILIQRELHRRYPLRYDLGGSISKRKPFNRWSYRLTVPLHFAVLRPNAFLRNIQFLRRRKWLRIPLDVAASTGIGTPGFALLRLIQHVRGRFPATENLCTERFDRWEDWADDVWKSARNRYSLIGDRSRAALESLYPEGHEHLIKCRFMTKDTKRLIGWAVITASRLKDHTYFGNMRLGAIVDMLAVPEDAYAVVSGALVAARQAMADLVIVNHSDHRWNQAIKRAGMLGVKTKDFLSLSTQLKRRFNPIDEYSSHFFFTRGDGHGPTSLWLSDYHSRETLAQTSLR